MGQTFTQGKHPRISGCVNCLASFPGRSGEMSRIAHQRLSSVFDLLLFFLCSLITTLTLTPPPNNALLANLDMYTFPPPVFDRLQYAKTEGEGLGERVTCLTSGRCEGRRDFFFPMFCPYLYQQLKITYR